MYKYEPERPSGLRPLIFEGCTILWRTRTMDSKPLIYILHGAWHSPQYFDAAKTRLEALNYTVICPKQPSTGAIPPVATLYDDASQVRAELDLLVEDGSEVFVVMHSYGGLVGSEAAAGLGKAERSKHGLQGGVIGLMYVCAFLLPVGHHLCTALGGELAPFIKAEVGSRPILPYPLVDWMNFRLTEVATRSIQSMSSTMICRPQSNNSGLRNCNITPQLLRRHL